jgi:hypothetical protein
MHRVAPPELYNTTRSSLIYTQDVEFARSFQPLTA